MATTTPLRYPGGKSVMTLFFREFIRINQMQNITYAEPYAGGAGSALNLLIDGTVNDIIINDASVPVFSFWNSLVNHSEEFMELFQNTPINISEWKRQRKVFLDENKECSVKLGFATFYMNRCNRSGILKAGPIGGNTAVKQKNANYKINARYNKETLSKRLNTIIDYKNKISVKNQDAISFLNDLNNLTLDKQRKTLVYLDPPYYIHGSELYMNSYTHKDHEELADYLRSIQNIKWVLSYDNVSQIRELYRIFNLYTFDLTYSVQTPKIGKELLTHSINSVLPTPLVIPRSTSPIPLVLIE